VGQIEHNYRAGLFPPLDRYQAFFGVHRDHDPLAAVFAADFFHHLWVVHSSGADDHPVDSGLKPGVGGGEVTDTATHLDRDIQAADDG